MISQSNAFLFDSYLNLYKLSFSVEEHVALAQLLYELFAIDDLSVKLRTKVASILTRLILCVDQFVTNRY